MMLSCDTLSFAVFVFFVFLDIVKCRLGSPNFHFRDKTCLTIYLDGGRNFPVNEEMFLRKGKIVRQLSRCSSVW